MSRGDFDNTVQQVLDRTDLVAIISEYVQLKKSGHDSYSGLCPFHEESAPSFSVSRKKGVYYCFGCKASGNAITFLSETLGIPRSEALRKLAEKAGVELPKQGGKQADVIQRDRDLLRQVMNTASIEFKRLLGSQSGEAARAYLQGRGMNADTIEAFGLGFGGGIRDLGSSIAALPGGMRAAASSGLLARSSDTYNRFHSRIIFPIRTSDATVVGFGGRWIGEADEKSPKYLNTSQNPLFQKGKLLYGLDRARQGIRKQKFSILVEGNFDVLAMHQAGFSNTVAPLGTSVTYDQVMTLARLGRRLVVLFDGDSAGRKAVLRLAGLCAQAGLDGRVAALPTGEDPDSMIAAGRGDEIRASIDKAVPIFDYFIRTLQLEYGTGPEAITIIAGKLRDLTEVVRNRLTLEAMVDRASQIMRVDRRNLARVLYQTRKPDDVKIPDKAMTGPEMDLLEHLLRDPLMIDTVIENGGETLLKNAELSDFLKDLITAYEDGQDIAQMLAAGALPPAIKDRLMKAVMQPVTEIQQGSTYAMNQVLLSLKIKEKEEERRNLIQEIRNGKGDETARKKAWELRKTIEILRTQRKQK